MEKKSALPKDLDAFKDALERPGPPLDWPLALKVMWHDVKGDWESAHNIAQDMYTALGSLLHAYLHRQEGDEFNAGYWYRRAGRDFPKMSLEEERWELVNSLLT
ncbi:hypothetical protein [Maribacter sp. 2307ULW6-5]|uniref:hypothetical protein n=1 Tax=Maribacter sp. 2307ULW6-5 TaxID=3386275 RepID=UPI0039BC83F2